MRKRVRGLNMSAGQEAKGERRKRRMKEEKRRRKEENS